MLQIQINCYGPQWFKIAAYDEPSLSLCTWIKRITNYTRLPYIHKQEY